MIEGLATVASEAGWKVTSPIGADLLLEGSGSLVVVEVKEKSADIHFATLAQLTHAAARVELSRPYHRTLALLVTPQELPPALLAAAIDVDVILAHVPFDDAESASLVVKNLHAVLQRFPDGNPVRKREWLPPPNEKLTGSDLVAARNLVLELHPNALLREIAVGENSVFRMVENDASSIIKVYKYPSRGQREREILAALAHTRAVPSVLGYGVDGDLAWLRMSDAGHWNLVTLPVNMEVLEASGSALRMIHDSDARLPELGSMDINDVTRMFQTAIDRLRRHQWRFGIESHVLDIAIELELRTTTIPLPAHTKLNLDEFVVDDLGGISIVDWESATHAPPEWDYTYAAWRVASGIGLEAAAAFRSGYGSTLQEGDYWPWVVFHSALMMVEAAERRSDLHESSRSLADDFTEAVDIARGGA